MILTGGLAHLILFVCYILLAHGIESINGNGISRPVNAVTGAASAMTPIQRLDNTDNNMHGIESITGNGISNPINAVMRVVSVMTPIPHLDNSGNDTYGALSKVAMTPMVAPVHLDDTNDKYDVVFGAAAASAVTHIDNNNIPHGVLLAVVVAPILHAHFGNGKYESVSAVFGDATACAPVLNKDVSPLDPIDYLAVSIVQCTHLYADNSNGDGRDALSTAATAATLQLDNNNGDARADEYGALSEMALLLSVHFVVRAQNRSVNVNLISGRRDGLMQLNISSSIVFSIFALLLINDVLYTYNNNSIDLRMDTLSSSVLDGGIGIALLSNIDIGIISSNYAPYSALGLSFLRYNNNTNGRDERGIVYPTVAPCPSICSNNKAIGRGLLCPTAASNDALEMPLVCCNGNAAGRGVLGPTTASYNAPVSSLSLTDMLASSNAAIASSITPVSSTSSAAPIAHGRIKNNDYNRGDVLQAETASSTVPIRCRFGRARMNNNNVY